MEFFMNTQLLTGEQFTAFVSTALGQKGGGIFMYYLCASFSVRKVRLTTLSTCFFHRGPFERLNYGGTVGWPNTWKQQESGQRRCNVVVTMTSEEVVRDCLWVFLRRRDCCEGRAALVLLALFSEAKVFSLSAVQILRDSPRFSGQQSSSTPGCLICHLWYCCDQIYIRQKDFLWSFGGTPEKDVQCWELGHLRGCSRDNKPAFPCGTWGLAVLEGWVGVKGSLRWEQRKT